MNDGHVNGESIEQQIFNKKLAEFETELTKLQELHGIVIVPIIQSNVFGIMPGLIYMDKKQYEAQIKAGAKVAGNNN